MCGFRPGEETDDLVKSVYLSVGRYDTEEERTRYRTELEMIASRLREGHGFEFDPTELERLRMQKGHVESISTGSLVRYLLRVFLPGIIFLLILIGVLYALKKM